MANTAPHHDHLGHTPYALPLFRSSSPAVSIGTVYGPDETSFSDADYDDDEFAYKCRERLEFNRLKESERLANIDPLLPPGLKTTVEDPFIQEQHEQVLRNLRAEVKKLEEDELFEEMMLRGSQVGMEPQPASNDIDVIMRGMMGPSTNNTSYYGSPNYQASGTTGFQNTSWMPSSKSPLIVEDTPDVSTTAAGRKIAKGKGKSRKR